jgi:hypothetical protein
MRAEPKVAASEPPTTAAVEPFKNERRDALVVRSMFWSAMLILLEEKVSK